MNQRCQLRNRDEIRRRLITNFSCGNQFPLKMDAASDPGALMMDPVPGDPGGGPESRDRAGDEGFSPVQRPDALGLVQL